MANHDRGAHSHAGGQPYGPEYAQSILKALLFARPAAPFCLWQQALSSLAAVPTSATHVSPAVSHTSHCLSHSLRAPAGSGGDDARVRSRFCAPRALQHVWLLARRISQRIRRRASRQARLYGRHGPRSNIPERVWKSRHPKAGEARHPEVRACPCTPHPLAATPSRPHPRASQAAVERAVYSANCALV